LVDFFHRLQLLQSIYPLQIEYGKLFQYKLFLLYNNLINYAEKNKDRSGNMKFISFQVDEGSIEWGIVDGEEVVQCTNLSSSYPNLLSVIEAGSEAVQEVKELIQSSDASRYSLSDTKVSVPFYPKKNVLCVGKNYKDHVLEMSNQDLKAVPEHPVLFTKPYTTIIEHLGSIQSYPELTQQLDYEGELAIIIGKKGINITKAEAMDYIFGYSIINDVTARDLQKRHQQFFKGKSLDTFAPFGPVIVHHSAITNPQELKIKTYVNDDLRQNGSTKDMIFSIPELIEVISAGMRLEPGDIIATGTPSGVGNGFKPPIFMKAGDRVRIEIETIGLLENKVI
jgi:2-keto-4-pentenoate hydratase/2-oxohepta-3-ene-1,7-dioic acid hydratase in catechol pathway